MLKASTRICIIILSLFFSTEIILSQECIEYAEIDGTPCGSCTPPEWDPTSSSPDIVDPGVLCSGLGESGSGGTAIHLFSNGSNDIEGVITEVQISNFVPGAQYHFSIYTAQCGNAQSDIELELDGVVYIIEPSSDWMLTEFCFVPSSSVFDLFITLTPHSGGMVSNTLIDSGVCDPTFCCILESEIEEDPIMVCPDEAYVIFSDYSNETGSTEITWTSDPSDGVDFLDDPTIINPTFYMPPDNDFYGETYIFTYMVEDEECFIIKEVELEVLPSLIPDFDFYLCEVYGSDQLPTRSNDNYTGSWEGDFFFEELGGTTEQYVFTLDPGQNNCIEQWTYEIPIESEELVYFDLVTEYCTSDDNRYRLPDYSDNDIEGEWDEYRFYPDEYDPGVYTFTFYPDMEEYCSLPYELEITFYDDRPVSFNFPITYCTSNDSLILPVSSIEGIEGTWNAELIDLNIPGSYPINFQPNSSSDCYTEYSSTIEVQDNLVNTFNYPDDVCTSSGIVELDTISLEGNIGTWDPVSFNLDTIFSSSVSAKWTPKNIGCQAEVTISINLVDPVIPVFDIPEELCKSYGAYILPTESENDIEGSWDLSEFDTETLSQDEIRLTFTPNSNYCADETDLTINIVDNIIPQFSFPLEYCAGEESFMLPMVSDNNINGSWSPPVIDPSTINSGSSASFTPEASNLVCAVPITLDFNLAQSIEPQFSLPEYLCIEDDVFIYPTTSVNGIEGSWETEQIDVSTFSGTVISNVFTPDDLECYLPFSSDIEVLKFLDLKLTETSPTTCESADGTITVINVDSNLEFSIDGGITWQTSPEFRELSAGQYTVTLAYNSLLPSCVITLTTTLSSPASATIIEVIVNPITNCTDNNGMVICESAGNNLEYSLDNGLTWQTENTFENLAAGNYEILVSADGDIQCSDIEAFEILSFPDTEIESATAQDPSDCMIADGMIVIDVRGQDLEYSIDGGLSFQADNTFSDLVGASYNVIVRSQVANDCIAETVVNLNSPSEPSIDDLVIKDVSDCSVKDGSIEILSSNTNIEYSIDGGVSWSTNSIFENLEQGFFEIAIRTLGTVNCIDEIIANISSPQSLDITDFVVRQPTDCISQDGSISIDLSLSDAEFSIDQGTTWQRSNLFDNLADGQYEVLVRNSLATACLEKRPATIVSPPCPCQDLAVDYTANLVTCIDDNSGQIEIQSVDGFYTNEDYQLVWEDGTNGLLRSDLSEGWYPYTISYDKNCEWTDSIYIDELDPLTFGLLAFDEDCANQGSIEIVDFQGGSGDYEFSLNGVDFQPSNLFTNLSSDDYEVFVQDVFDCEKTERTSIKSNFDLSLEIPEVNSITQGQSTFLNPLINESTIDSFTWMPSTGIINPNELIAEVSPFQTTEYTLTIHFGQCTEIRTIVVEVIPKVDVYIPSIFSPSSTDGNDLFKIFGPAESDITINSFSIYDKWGNLIFDKNNFTLDEEDGAWDGTYNQKDVVAGVYVYYLSYTLNEKILSEAGTITLVR